MADEDDIAALVVDNGSGMCKGKSFLAGITCFLKLLQPAIAMNGSPQ